MQRNRLRHHLIDVDMWLVHRDELYSTTTLKSSENEYRQQKIPQ